MNGKQMAFGAFEVAVGGTGIGIPDPATTAAGAGLAADGIRRIGDGMLED